MRLALLLTIPLLLAGCATPSDEPAPEGDATLDDPDGSMGNMTIEPVRLSISLVERPGAGVPPTTMALDPARLEVREDQRVVLTVTNDGRAPHDLVIEGLAETETIGPGESAELEFVAQERGEFPMFCSLGGDGPTGHRGQGMDGVFVVV